MRIRLKGLNRVKKRLADGSQVTYYYAWKGGPRLEGTPGSPEFVASYNQAVATRRSEPNSNLSALIAAYRTSPQFLGLAPRTRKDYDRQITKIGAKFGSFPLIALKDRRARGEFLDWRDELATTSPRQADYALSVLALILAWATHRGKIDRNPLERPGKLYKGSRRDAVWSDQDESQYMQAVPDHLKLPLLLAIWTGQREGDLLSLKWSQFDGSYIRLKQAKTGQKVRIPVAKALKTALETEKQRLVAAEKFKATANVLVTSRGQAWTEGGFRASWNKKRKSAGIEGLTFNDLRGTAVTRLALAGCSVPEIASITGHSLKEVESVLDRHYLSRDNGLGEAAIKKLEHHRNL